MQYWRRKNEVAMSETTLDGFLYQQSGFVEITAAETYPAMRYYLCGALEAVDPRRWERETGLPATRSTEYCRTCGQHATQCVCEARRASKGALRDRIPQIVTTRPSEHRHGPRHKGGYVKLLIDIVCNKHCKRYFIWHGDSSTGALGIAYEQTQATAYAETGWTLSKLKEIKPLAHYADSRYSVYTIGGPDKCCRQQDFLAVLHGNKEAWTIKTFPPMPKVPAPDNR